MTQLLLVRHGQTTWNAEGRLQGSSEVPLSTHGRQEVLNLSGIVAEFEPTSVISSDLGRTRETAALLGYPEATIDPRWREADLGEWTGRTILDVMAADGRAYQEWREGRSEPPGGEPWEQLVERVSASLASLPKGGDETSAVVTHGGPIRAACSILLGLVPAQIVPVSTASVTVIDVGPTPRLRTFNLTPAHAPRETTE